MRQYKREPLRAGEADRLLAAAETPFARSAVVLMLELGLRLSELVGISESSVDWEQARVRILGKGSRYRILPMSDAAVDAMKIWLEVKKPRTSVATMRAVQRAVAKAGVNAGIQTRVIPHRLRHHFAVACLKRGINLRTLQLLMAHSSLNTTACYLSLSPEDVVEEFRSKWNQTSASKSPSSE